MPRASVCDTDANAADNANAHTICYTDTYDDSYGYADSNTNNHANRYTDAAHSHTYRYSQGYAAASSDAAPTSESARLTR
jgi:hypothetical protein